VRTLLVRTAFGIALGLLVALTRPGWTDIAFRLLVLYLGTLLLIALVARASTALPRARRSNIEQVLAAPAPVPERLAELERIERLVALSLAHAGDVHSRLRPMLAEIAAPLLAARGVDLERNPEAARELLGEDAWELVRPAERPADPFGPGTTEARLRAAVDRLERMAR
jgi:hypothetical protein